MLETYESMLEIARDGVKDKAAQINKGKAVGVSQGHYDELLVCLQLVDVLTDLIAKENK